MVSRDPVGEVVLYHKLLTRKAAYFLGCPQVGIAKVRDELHLLLNYCR